jgi:hypothetical protein
MEEYQIALSPEFGIRPADFVAAWNEEVEAHDNGEARLDEATSKGYIEPVTTTIVIAIATGIAANAIYDLIKKILAKKGMHTTHTHFEELSMPDGTHLVIVDKDEKQQ